MAMVEVLVSDENSGGYEYNKEYFATIDQWARERCNSYIGYQVQDVSDVSLYWDEIAVYRFTSDIDVVLFKLKWH